MASSAHAVHKQLEPVHGCAALVDKLCLLISGNHLMPLFVRCLTVSRRVCLLRCGYFQVPPDRQEKMAAVAAHRLPNVTCVLEGLYDGGNVGAVGRSAEAFGITDIAIVSLHG